MMRSKPLNFTIHINSLILRQLLLDIALRAYNAGVEDGTRGVSDPSRVHIPPEQMRKFL